MVVGKRKRRGAGNNTLCQVTPLPEFSRPQLLAVLSHELTSGLTPANCTARLIPTTLQSPFGEQETSARH